MFFIDDYSFYSYVSSWISVGLENYLRFTFMYRAL